MAHSFLLVKEVPRGFEFGKNDKFGSVRFGSVRFGSVRFGSAQLMKRTLFLNETFYLVIHTFYVFTFLHIFINIMNLVFIINCTYTLFVIKFFTWNSVIIVQLFCKWWIFYQQKVNFYKIQSYFYLKFSNHCPTCLIVMDFFTNGTLFFVKPMQSYFYLKLRYHCPTFL